MKYDMYALRVFVSDWNRALRFYTELLEIPITVRDDDAGWAQLATGGAQLALERADPSDAEATAMVGRFVGVSLEVQDLHQTHRTLTERGVEFSTPPTRQEWGGTLAHVRDPDGNVITLLDKLERGHDSKPGSSGRDAKPDSGAHAPKPARNAHAPNPGSRDDAPKPGSSDPASEAVDLYDSTYGSFADKLYADVRARTFGEDIGQNGWLTAEEQDLFVSWLRLDADSRLLDVACGSGGPTLRIARTVGCTVQGVDIHEQGIAAARRAAEAEGLQHRASFDRVDASQPLPFDDGAFDGLLCVDAVNHLADREATLRDWARRVRTGGRVVFTDPIVVTGALTNAEMAIRSSIGFFLFVPPGLDERILESVGLEVVDVVDRTENMAAMAQRWHEARAERADELRRVEGDATFEGQQRFFEVTARLADERRLSRLAFHCRRP